MIGPRHVKQIVEDDSTPQDAAFEGQDSFLYSIMGCVESTYHACSSLITGHAYEPIGSEDEREKEPSHKKLTELFRLANVAIPMSYFSIGIALTFISTPAMYYAVDTLDVDSAVVNTLNCVQSIPWGFKLFYGILSDCQPILSMRRKPYFIIGWSVFVLCNLVLALIGTPSITWLISMVLLQTAGYILSDVMADALMVERSKLEPSLRVGTMQATCYTLRYMGNIIGSTCGTVLYNKEEWGWGLSIGQVFTLNALLPVVLVFPFLYHLSDPFEWDQVRSLDTQMRDLWDTVQKRSIWQPMIFIYIYDALMVPNAAWSNFLIDGLDFSDWMIGLVTIAGATFAWLGILFYRFYLYQDSWRKVYGVVTCVMVFFSCCQLILIFQLNKRWGISNLVFALGDNSATDFTMAVLFLPMVKMYLQLCPTGAEGATYAMLTTYANVAYSVAYTIGTLLSEVWDVSNDTLSSGDFSGMWRLTLLTSCLNPLALVFIGFIPESPEHQRELQKSEDRSWWGGFFFVLVLSLSLVWSVVQAVVITFA